LGGIPNKQGKGLKQAATYYHVKESPAKIQVHQGGTRSGKTFSILTALIELCHHNENAGAVITIARKTFPAIRASVMRDFFTILEREGIYNVANHNKSEATYILFGNLVEFISIDQPQKVRGRKRDILFVNEANELNLEDWRQLILRTTGRILIDYNPSDEFHWIYDEVIPRDDADFYQTTYLDNPHLPDAVIGEIERLQQADPDYWKVYGLGERGVSRSTILTHWKEYDQIPTDYKLLNIGLDFGYTNDPTAIVKVYTDGHGFILDEVCYATGLTNSAISQTLRDAEVGRGMMIVADSAEPKSIDEIHGHGFNVHPARKGRDSVRAGLDFLRSRPLGVTSRSVNGIKELRNYKWKEDKNGRQLNEPVDAFNHFIDASRYAITHTQTNPNFGRYALG
jgi:phage terminase large subunit